MQSMINYVKEILGIYPSYPVSPPNSRKRRILSDNSHGIFKIRRLNDYKMQNSNFENQNTPSSSKIFKKPADRYTKPLSSRPLNMEVIDLSDDEDVIEVSRGRSLSNGNWIDVKYGGRPPSLWSNDNRRRSAQAVSLEKESSASVIQRGRASIKNSSRVLSPQTFKPQFRCSALNESFRFQDKQKYREMLLKAAPTASTYTSTLDNLHISSPREKNEIASNYFASSRTHKIMAMFKPKVTQTIDLTEQENGICGDPIPIKDSDSEPEVIVVKPKVEPINTVKKLLETELVMKPDWLKSWDEKNKKTQLEKERMIMEEKIKRDKFKDVNTTNIHSYLEAKVRSCMQLKDIVEPIEVPDEEGPELPQLNAKQEAMVTDALRPEPKGQVLIDKFNLRITRVDIQTLKGLNWLNDEVINFYVNLLIERGQMPNMPKVHSMNTFFYPKLVSTGYSSLRRWTKRVDIFAQDYLVVPIHLGVHWCMAIVSFKEKSVKYYDSMGGSNHKCLEALFTYLKEEHKDKKKSEFDASNWTKAIVKNIPQQMNGSDCGMFSCMYAEFITRNAKITFTQEHMPYFRRKMIYEIITGKLLINKLP